MLMLPIRTDTENDGSCMSDLLMTRGHAHLFFHKMLYDGRPTWQQMENTNHKTQTATGHANTDEILKGASFEGLKYICVHIHTHKKTVKHNEVSVDEADS